MRMPIDSFVAEALRSIFGQTSCTLDRFFHEAGTAKYRKMAASAEGQVEQYDPVLKRLEEDPDKNHDQPQQPEYALWEVLDPPLNRWAEEAHQRTDDASGQSKS
jgi:hypothetical protein